MKVSLRGTALAGRPFDQVWKASTLPDSPWNRAGCIVAFVETSGTVQVTNAAWMK
jgi:hypothetical protein